MARDLKHKAPKIPVIVGGTFASFNAVHILEDCPFIDCVGVGEGEELLIDYMDHLSDPGSVPNCPENAVYNIHLTLRS